jgi:hypothetical protein
MPQATGAFLWLGLANVGLSGVYLSPDKSLELQLISAKLFLSRISG